MIVLVKENSTVSMAPCGHKLDCDGNLYFIIPMLPGVVYAALIPVVYYYGREVRDAERSMGGTSMSFLLPLMPWMWSEKDNRMDLYAPLGAMVLAGFTMTFWKIQLIS